MNPMLEMRKLLEARRTPSSGTVVSVSGRILTVGTYKGSLIVRSTDATAYEVGDEIQFNGGIVTGRLKPLSSIAVYHV